VRVCAQRSSCDDVWSCARPSPCDDDVRVCAQRSSCDDVWSCARPSPCDDDVWSCDPSSCEPRSSGAWSSCDRWSYAQQSCDACAPASEPRSSSDRCSCGQSTSSCASTSSPVTYAPWTFAQSTYGRKTYEQPACGVPFSSVRRSSSQPTPAPPLCRGRDLLSRLPFLLACTNKLTREMRAQTRIHLVIRHDLAARCKH
jgi:hypothetical protein